MSGFNPACFHRYDELTWFEKLFLRFCCYHPPRPRREEKAEDVTDTGHFHRILERAYGTELWPLIKGREVLDLGCGAGAYALALAEEGAGRVVGLDIQGRFGFAQEEAERRGHRQLYFVRGSTEVLADNSFDVVISHDSFEHFANPDYIFDEMVRVTRPGGNLLIKFGLPWRNPWGRHMSGTVRADRPWVHLLVSERTLMRCHSAYHNQPRLFDRFTDLPGGLNRMTIGRLKRIIKHLVVKRTQVKVVPLYSLKFLTALPWIQEFFVAEVTARCDKAPSQAGVSPAHDGLPKPERPLAQPEGECAAA